MFSHDKVNPINVLISKNREYIDNFFEDNKDLEGALILGTHNGTLISLEHTFGAGVGPDQNITIKFADSGGKTLQSLFSINIEESIKRSYIGTQQDLFLISYGIGSNRSDWSSPGYHYLIGADYEILVDGLEITTLQFAPSRMLIDPGNPGTANDYLTTASKRNISEIVGEVDEAGNLIFNDNDKIAEAIINLYTKGAEQVFGLNAKVVLPKDILIEYISRERARLLSPGSYNISTQPHNIILDYDKDDNPIFGVFMGERAHSLVAVFNLAGIVLTREKSSRIDIDSETFVDEGLFVPPSVPFSRYLTQTGTLTPFPLDLYSDSDKDVINQKFASDEPEQPQRYNLVINLNISYRRGKSTFRRSFLKLFDALRAGGGYNIPLEKKRIWKEVGNSIVELQPVIYIQNNADTIRDMWDRKPPLIPESFDGNSLVILGDITSILEYFGNVGTASARKSFDYYYTESKDDKKKKFGSNLKPYVGEALVLETSKNIISFTSNVRVPALSFFRNNTFYKAAETKASKEEYLTFIQNFLRGAVERFSNPSDNNPLSEESIEYYDYKKIAIELYKRLSTMDDKAVGDLFINSDSDFAGLLTYLYMYYNYVGLGTILATTTTLPYFHYSDTDVIGTNVFVKIRRNPSPYDHLMDKVYNSYHSGLYKLLGYKHSISNTQATSTFYLNRISLEAGEPTERIFEPGETDISLPTVA